MFLFAHRERARTTLELFIWVIRWQRWAANHNPHNLTLLLCEGLVTQIMSEQNKAEACFGNTLQCSDLICYFRGGSRIYVAETKWTKKICRYSHHACFICVCIGYTKPGMFKVFLEVVSKGLVLTFRNGWRRQTDGRLSFIVNTVQFIIKLCVTLDDCRFVIWNAYYHTVHVLIGNSVGCKLWNVVNIS